MSTLLAVFDPGADRFHDAFTLDAILDHRPERVTVVITGTGAALTEEGPEADAIRDRLAWLLTAIERRTGAAVSGVVGDPTVLDDAFATVVGGSRVLAAV